jgi:o-succinylbenzoate synthase
MKIWAYGYQLISRHSQWRPRRGALLKVEWDRHQTGYSDLHPWPEFGEPNLDEHLAQLSSFTFTKLVELSLEFNFIDSELRAHRRNAFLGLALPRSHRLVTDLGTFTEADLKASLALGFDCFKFKMGKDLEAETKELGELAKNLSGKIRLDFGGGISSPHFVAWWQALDESIKNKIDFIEDPSGDLRVTTPGPWADDWHRNPESFIKVVKPARDGIEQPGRYRRIVFSHSLDHSLGQACALWSAARFYLDYPQYADTCGLAAGDVYEPDEFSSKWQTQGARQKPTPGFGFGFDETLESRKWDRIL